MKIRKRDGTVIEAGDGYILADGETLMIGGLQFMDGRQMITDGTGRPAGSRPGFLFADIDVAEAVKETNYQNYCDAIGQRWKSDRWSKPSGHLSTADKSNPPQSFSTGDAVAAAHGAVSRGHREPVASMTDFTSLPTSVLTKIAQLNDLCLTLSTKLELARSELQRLRVERLRKPFTTNFPPTERASGFSASGRGWTI